uniref:Outer membrane protein (Porin) n=1 Tax=Candidatus Kentrum sp. DK TaxID=2126562 RepID=A0A450SE92_9GAMM|nr:MAG: Outer membrane protein (porin) [Candidatus Kentron sp. DK]
MQKKLITLAIAGALAIPGAAMADVTAKSDADINVYGKIHASWDYVNVANTGAGSDSKDDNTGVFRNSRLGFKGAEDLGNGLKGIWQVETLLNTTSSTGNSGSVGLRNTFVGLEGDNWGKVFVGRHDTPYKMATAKLDIFSDTIADYNNIIGAHMMPGTSAGTSVVGTVSGIGTPVIATTAATNASVASNFNEREPQVVAYVTPNFNGFQAAIARESWQNNEVAGSEELEGWSLMGMYDQGPFFASLSYEDQSGGANASTAGADAEAWKVGAGYRFGNSTVGAVYEDIDHKSNSYKSASRGAFMLNAAHKFGANELKVAYGKAKDSDANNNDGADTWAIGIDHNFSKRTKVYAIYTQMNNDTNGNYGLYTGQNNGDADGDAFYESNAAGRDLDALSVGIIHSF